MNFNFTFLSKKCMVHHRLGILNNHTQGHGFPIKFLNSEVSPRMNDIIISLAPITKRPKSLIVDLQTQDAKIMCRTHVESLVTVKIFFCVKHNELPELDLWTEIERTYAR